MIPDWMVLRVACPQCKADAGTVCRRYVPAIGTVVKTAFHGLRRISAQRHMTPRERDLMQSRRHLQALLEHRRTDRRRARSGH